MLNKWVCYGSTLPQQTHTFSPLRPRALAGEDGVEELAGIAGFDLGNLLGRALGDDGAAAVAALGTHVNHVVGGFDDVEIVLDDYEAVARVGKALPIFNPAVEYAPPAYRSISNA